jgi:hypothetical protein
MHRIVFYVNQPADPGNCMEEMNHTDVLKDDQLGSLYGRTNEIFASGSRGDYNGGSKNKDWNVVVEKKWFIWDSNVARRVEGIQI